MEAVTAQNHHGGPQLTAPAPAPRLLERAPVSQLPLPKITPAHFRLQGTGKAVLSSALILPTNLKEYFQFEPGEYLCQTGHSKFQYPSVPCVRTEGRSSAGLSSTCNSERRNCINAIKYGYRLNTSPLLRGKLTYAANQEIQFLEMYR